MTESVNKNKPPSGVGNSRSKDLSRETGYYAVAMIFSGLIQVAFLPFMSRYLTPEAIGEFGILRTIAEAIAGIVVLGLPTAVIRTWQRTDTHRAILKRVMFLPLIPIVIMSAVVFLLRGKFESVLHIEHPEFLIHAVLLGSAVALIQIALSMPRAQGLPRQYFSFQVIRGIAALAVLGLLLYLMPENTGFPLSPISIFLTARWLPAFAIVIAAVVLMWRETASSANIKTPKKLTGEMLTFSLPLIPSTLALIVLSSADMFMLRNMLPDNLAASGYYEWANRACLLLMPVILGFNMAWKRFIFRKREEGGTLAELGRAGLLFMIAVNWMAVVLAMASPELVKLIGGESYSEAAGVLPLLAGATALYGLFLVSQTGCLLTGQTKFIAGMTIFGAFLNIGFNLRLIPVAGALGAGFATLCTNLFMAVSLFWLGRRVFPISFSAVAVLAIIPVAYYPLSTLNSLWRVGIIAGATIISAITVAAFIKSGKEGQAGAKDDS